MPSKINVASFAPLDSQVLVEPDFAKVTNLLIPENVNKTSLSPFGTIVAIGPGRQMENGQRQEMDLQPGDRVQVHRWGGCAVEVMGRALLCMDRGHIIGKITDAPAGRTLSLESN